MYDKYNIGLQVWLEHTPNLDDTAIYVKTIQ